MEESPPFQPFSVITDKKKVKKMGDAPCHDRVKLLNSRPKPMRLSFTQPPPPPTASSNAADDPVRGEVEMQKQMKIRPEDFEFIGRIGSGTGGIIIMYAFTR